MSESQILLTWFLGACAWWIVGAGVISLFDHAGWERNERADLDVVLFGALLWPLAFPAIVMFLIGRAIGLQIKRRAIERDAREREMNRVLAEVENELRRTP